MQAWRRMMPAALILAYWVVFPLTGFHLLVGGAILAVCYSGAWIGSLQGFLLPFLITIVSFDSLRYWVPSVRGAVRVAEPYLFDQRFFGILSETGARLTPNEWLQLHTYPALDLVTGVMYLLFIAIYFAMACYWYWRCGRETRPAWAFLWVDLLSYATYCLYPAAPPWYVAKYGLGPARLGVASDPAGCARFDQLLGTHVFAGMYGVGPNVFGAIPSLHVAYPLMAVYFSQRFGRLRAFAIAYYVLMCFSAVYLNHHYLLDVIWGSAYGLLIAWAVDRVWIRSGSAPVEVPPLGTFVDEAQSTQKWNLDSEAS